MSRKGEHRKTKQGTIRSGSHVPNVPKHEVQGKPSPLNDMRREPDIGVNGRSSVPRCPSIRRWGFGTTIWLRHCEANESRRLRGGGVCERET